MVAIGAHARMIARGTHPDAHTHRGLGERKIGNERGRNDHLNGSHDSPSSFELNWTRHCAVARGDCELPGTTDSDTIDGVFRPLEVPRRGTMIRRVNNDLSRCHVTACVHGCTANSIPSVRPMLSGGAKNGSRLQYWA